jgi:diacylglycerol kinase family enzyme
VPVHHVQRMAAHVAAGATRHIDVRFVNDVPFVNAAGFGFDVDVLERMRTRSSAIANFS